jgi:thiosulfate/3-mercaptopyruvate sulfurtransferase
MLAPMGGSAMSPHVRIKFSSVCRFIGLDPEPRVGLSSGHIPHSFSLPFNAFLQTNPTPNSEKTFTTFLSPNELRRKLVGAVGTEYARLILEGKRGVTTTCGSGMTAGVLWLGLKLINESTSVSLYDEVR